MSPKIYIFVLCPPFQGSSIILNLLSSSPNTSTLLGVNGTWAGESQWLYKYNGDDKYLENRNNPEYKLDMKVINNIFDKYYDNNKYIYVEKSPSLVLRAKDIQDYFSKLGDVYFIISIRNPYSTNIDINKWVLYAKCQKNNIKNLENIIVTNYEELCLNTEKVIKRILDKIPLLENLSSIDNNYYNSNERFLKIHTDKVNRIINKKSKNKILKNNLDLLKFFGYKYLS